MENLKLESITTEIKNSLEALNNRLEMTADRSNAPEDRSMENIQSEDQSGGGKKTEEK